MGKAAKQAKNKAKKQNLNAFLKGVKGNLQEELNGELGEDILSVLKEKDGRL